MYNYWQNGAENCGNEYLASNQVFGGSNPSGRVIFSKTYGASEIFKFRLNPKVPIKF